MATDQYHEPASELSQKVRTFARMITGLIEEAEAIGWYEQRISVEKDKQARAIMEDAQKEEFKHFGMDLEFLLRQKKEWRDILKGILFTNGDKGCGESRKSGGLGLMFWSSSIREMSLAKPFLGAPHIRRGRSRWLNGWLGLHLGARVRRSLRNT